MKNLKIILKVPNLVMQGLYVERIQKTLLPEPDDRDDGKWAAEKVYQKGDMAPLCKFPDKRHAVVYDVLIEFKFVILKDAGITGTQAEKLSENALFANPLIRQELDNGTKQVIEYGKKLESKHKNLRLVKFVVVSLGFERVCFKKVEGIKK